MVWIGIETVGDDNEGRHWLRLVGELDIVDAESVCQALKDAAHSTVVVDLSDLEFIDSSGIGAFVRARRHIIEQGNSIEFTRPRLAVRRVFQLTGLDDWLND